MTSARSENNSFRWNVNAILKGRVYNIIRGGPLERYLSQIHMDHRDPITVLMSFDLLWWQNSVARASNTSSPWGDNLYCKYPVTWTVCVGLAEGVSKYCLGNPPVKPACRVFLNHIPYTPVQYHAGPFAAKSAESVSRGFKVLSTKYLRKVLHVSDARARRYWVLHIYILSYPNEYYHRTPVLTFFVYRHTMWLQ